MEGWLQPLAFHSRAVVNTTTQQLYAHVNLVFLVPLPLHFFTPYLLKRGISIHFSPTGAFSTLLLLSCKLEIQYGPG